MSKNENDKEKENVKAEKYKPADEIDIDLYKRYVKGPYSEKLKVLEDDIKGLTKNINSICGVRESETGLALPSMWNQEND